MEEGAAAFFLWIPLPHCSFERAQRKWGFKVKTPNESFEEKMSDHRWAIYQLSRNLLAWGVLIESQSEEHEKLAELEGLGMSLRDYSGVLQRICSSLDELEVAMANPSHRKKAHSKRRD